MIKLRMPFMGLVLLLGSLMIGFSCSSDDNSIDPADVEMQFSKESITFSESEQDGSVTIKCNTNWTVTSSVDWCILSTTSSNSGTIKVHFSLTNNATGSDRTGSLDFTAGGASASVVIIQTFDSKKVEVSALGELLVVELSVSGDYSIDIDSDWMIEGENSNSEQLEFIVAPNITTEIRVGVITYQLSSTTKYINVTQAAGSEYIADDNTNMSGNAQTIAYNIYLGWNLGNSLEAIGDETTWGNPKVNEELIKAVKNAGFNAIRIPCAWSNHLEDETSYKIKNSWLIRVKEVVDYCVDNDLYAILNIHWDNGWLECTDDKQVAVNNKQAALWKQIAWFFRDYDEHLLFAGANEPEVSNQTEADVLKVYMQTFVDVIRATGGRNYYRNLIIQGPLTNIDKTDSWMSMPTDVTADRLLAEVHYYTPWQFCGLSEDASWGNIYYFWGANYHVEGATGRYPDWDCEEEYLLAQFQKMKTKFVDQGIPVILGEYGAIRRVLSDAYWQEQHDESRAYYLEYVTKQAKNYGMVPFYWDEGSLNDLGFGVFNRNSNSVGDQQALNGLIIGANAGIYP